MSGRVAAIDMVASAPNVIYVGGATSGVWKTTDGATTWTPVFNDQDTSSIGAVAICQANPDIVWVGTGEGKPRYGTGVGRGVYKSLDAGLTWRRVGLEHSERIQRVVPHPTNPDVAYVAALGPAWSDGEERGVYRTTDGGRTWQRLLHTNARSGAADLVMDPTNPNKLFAAMWEFRREPWFFTSGGEGSGLYASNDGGLSWRQMTANDGIPDGMLGRIGLAIAASDPAMVYALIQATENGLYRSEDGGRTWQRVAAGERQFGILARPWYFQGLRVDPRNENRVYHVSEHLEVSEDGGRSFHATTNNKGVHGDQHALSIDPNDPKSMVLGGDGGVYVTRNRGHTWRFVDNLPFGQYYHISVDMETPYRVYGGMQDNDSHRVPSSVWEAEGIRNHHCASFGGGDGTTVYPLPDNARYVYNQSPMGSLRLADTLTGVEKSLRPAAPDLDTALRFNNAPGLAVDPFDADGVYYGSQFLHKSTDRGETWTIVSPDLTTNDPAKQRYWRSGGLTWEQFGGEVHTTIVSIAPSPVERGVIWVGTDDGKIQLTRDGGQTWKDLIGRTDGPASGSYVAHIEPSSYDRAEAFLVINDFQRGDFAPYVFKTVDFGDTWQNLATPEIDGFVHVLEQDPVERDLLYIGTEFGLFVSLNGGRSWFKWTHGLPTVAVRGLVVHPREHDLVVGTFGRSAYVLDDVRPLRALAQEPDILNRAAYLFPPAPVIQHWVGRSDGPVEPGQGTFVGENRPYGAMITYVGDPAGEGEAIIEIRDENDRLVRRLTDAAKPGLNRVVWDLRQGESIEIEAYYAGQGVAAVPAPEVLPGSYQVRVKIGQCVDVQRLEVSPDPRLAISQAGRRARVDAQLRVRDCFEAIRRGIHQVGEVVAAIELALRLIDRKEDPVSRELRRMGTALKDGLLAVSRRLHFVFDQQDVMVESDEETMRRGWPGGVSAYLLRHVAVILDSSWEAPSETHLAHLAQAETRLQVVLGGLDRLLKDEYATFRTSIAEADLRPAPVLDDGGAGRADWGR
jgi:photosystem II stability/assembly factor-like uncharacterized protein